MAKIECLHTNRRLKPSRTKMYLLILVIILYISSKSSADGDHVLSKMIQSIATNTSIQEYKEPKQDELFKFSHQDESSNKSTNNEAKEIEDLEESEPLSDLLLSEINIHIIPHSHTDAGWIESIDWYYNNWVKNIFSNIFEEMYENKDITFVWADTNYLHQWFEAQNNETQQKVFEIIKRGQLEFVGGGWVQNDESLSDMKRLQYLHERFNATPTVGWQIDPFGYNSFMPSVFKELGYKYLVLNRIGDIRKESFKNSSNMDFWLESSELGNKDKILAHVLPRHYEPINYDSLISSIPSETDSEKDKIKFVKQFFSVYVKEQIKGYKSEEFMMLMGKDFGFNNQRGVLGKIDYMNKVVM